MTIKLIGVHRSWRGQPLTPSQRDRFAASLGIANAQPAQTSMVGDSLLATTGQQRGWRPQIAADGSRVLFAGYIDNRKQLANELGMAQSSDEALYAAGYAAWGDAVDLKVIGQFATIVTHPERHAIRLVRSPLAAPPLNYWHDRDRFLVASIANALFSTGEVEQRVDQQKIADSLFLNLYDGTRSWFEGVSRLAGGTRATATRDGVVVESYYDISAIPKVRFKDERDYVVAASELLEEGVRAALDGFSRPAVSLSGGFDSQAVAAFTARCRPGQPIETFTSVPEAEWDGAESPWRFGDERPYVEALAAMYPEIRPHWIDAKGLFFEHNLSSFFLLTGAPPRNTMNLYWIHEVYAQARASGCDVMLNAESGNLTFSFDGEGTMATMMRQGQWLRVWKEAGLLKHRHANSRLRAIASRALMPFAPAWFHVALGRLGLIKIDEPFETWCPLNRDYAESMDLARRAEAMGYDPLYRFPKSTRGWREEEFTLSTQDGGDMAQAFDLFHGMETRDPTTYRPFVEFCLAIPDDQYLGQGQTRRLARRMMRGIVPDMVLDETRKGQQAADWHLRLGRLRGELITEIDRLSDDEGIAAILNLGSLRAALVDWPESSLGQPAMRLNLALTRGLTTARFIRFVEGRND